MSELLLDEAGTEPAQQKCCATASNVTDTPIAFLNYPAVKPTDNFISMPPAPTISVWRDYKPILIVALASLSLGLIVALSNDANFAMRWMTASMGTFFIILACLKLIDLKAFVISFARYDLVAKADRRYGYLYPFMELILGGLYLWGYLTSLVNLLTFCLIAISTIGVWQALRRGKNLDCACMGSRIKLKLSTVSLIENIGMGSMALLMLLF